MNLSTSTSALVKSLTRKIDWEAFFDHITTIVFQLILLTIFLVIVNWIGKKIIKHIFENNWKATAKISSRKIDTVYSLTLNLFKYVLIFFWIYAFLSAIGLPVGTLIAGAGIFSLAIGLGAQGFVSDVVNGMFILLEQQISVGEFVTIGGIEGRVTYVGIRTTQLQSLDGTLNFITNRNITSVSNKSRNNMQALMEIPLSSDAPFNEITKIITEINQNLNLEKLSIAKRPYIVGFSNQHDGTLVLQVSAFTRPGAQFKVKNTLLEKYLSAIKAAKIDLPK